MFGRLLLSLMLIGLPLSYATPAHAQIGPPAQTRTAETIIINGQETQGVMVTDNGVLQSYTCPSPQPYTAADGSSTGWACFDQASGMWLLNAQAPAQSAGVYSEQPVYEQPSTVYNYYGSPAYSYPYGYGYGSPYYG